MQLTTSNRNGSNGFGGFTLIELLVVVTIIAILIAILLPAMGFARTQAKKAATTTLLNSISTGLEQYYGDFNAFPPSQNVSTGMLDFNRGSLMLAEGLTGYLPAANDNAGQGIANDPAFGFRLRPGGVGKIYGPYAQPSNASWKAIDATHQVFVDVWGNEILYYRAVPATFNGTARTTISSVFTSLGSNTAPPGVNFTGIFNIDDNSAEPGIVDPSSAVQTAPNAPTASFFSLLGASSNAIGAGDNVVGKNSFLLVSAGPDLKYFTGNNIVAGGK